MDNTDKQQVPQFSYEEIPGRNQGVIYCHWPIAFKAYFFIRDIAQGRFLLLPEHRNDKTARLLETMKGWFDLTYISPKRTQLAENASDDDGSYESIDHETGNF
ncbi:MAG: hypothetical protein WCF67_05440 [Chitinophagaceae bacterium]